VERVMSGWTPHIDLARLLDALGREIVATTDQEVGTACFEDGDSIHAAAKDVRALIGAVIDDPDDPDAGVAPVGTADGREHRLRQH
jgi:hypothetical protein